MKKILTWKWNFVQYFSAQFFADRSKQELYFLWSSYQICTHSGHFPAWNRNKRRKRKGKGERKKRERKRKGKEEKNKRGKEQKSKRKRKREREKEKGKKRKEKREKEKREGKMELTHTKWWVINGVLSMVKTLAKKNKAIRRRKEGNKGGKKRKGEK